MLKIKLENCAVELKWMEKEDENWRLKGKKWKWGHIYAHVKKTVC
jgi:hypothetical protein